MTVFESLPAAERAALDLVANTGKARLGDWPADMEAAFRSLDEKGLVRILGDEATPTEAGLRAATTYA